jgi:hypothetical protein
MIYDIIKSENGDLTLELRTQAKTKAGEKIKKLPPAYPIIGQYEKAFNKSYFDCINEYFIKPFIKKLNED